MLFTHFIISSAISCGFKKNTRNACLSWVFHSIICILSNSSSTSFIPSIGKRPYYSQMTIISIEILFIVELVNKGWWSAASSDTVLSVTLWFWQYSKKRFAHILICFWRVGRWGWTLLRKLEKIDWLIVKLRVER